MITIVKQGIHYLKCPLSVIIIIIIFKYKEIEHSDPIFTVSHLLTLPGRKFCRLVHCLPFPERLIATKGRMLQDHREKPQAIELTPVFCNTSILRPM